MEDYVIGIDIGGTNIRAGLFDQAYDLIGTVAREESSKKGSFMNNVYATIDDVISQNPVPEGSDIKIGISCTGPVDPFDGKILSPQMLQASHINLVEDIEAHYSSLNAQAYVLQDSHAHALGYKTKLYPETDFFGIMVLGTGLGAATIGHGGPHLGSAQRSKKGHEAWEIGSVPYLGRTLGDYVSGMGLASIYDNIAGELDVERDEEVHEAITMLPPNLRAKAISEHAHEGDKICNLAYFEMFSHMETPVGIMDLANPAFIILDGPVIHGAPKDLLKSFMSDYIADHGEEDGFLRIGNLENAALIGAAAYARNPFHCVNKDG